jgi:hypothetical protein
VFGQGWAKMSALLNLSLTTASSSQGGTPVVYTQ